MADTTQSGPWERYSAATPAASGESGPWERYAGVPGAPASTKARGILGAANDTAIEVANAAVGGLGAIGNFIAPGNPASKAIDRFVEYGESQQSDAVKADREKFRQQLASADGVGDEIGAVGEYIRKNPLQATAQVVGSLALPIGAIRSVARGAELAGLGARGATIAARTAGIATGAGMSGGDAAGTAYKQVEQIPDDVLLRNPDVQALSESGMPMDQIRNQIATTAARDASVVPAILGGVQGAFGAEKLLAGIPSATRGVRGVLATGATEALTQGAAAGASQYEGQRAAAEYDPSIDPTKGVAGTAALSAAQGGLTGAAVHTLTRGGGRGAQAQDDSPASRYAALAARRAAEEGAPPPLALPAPYSDEAVAVDSQGVARTPAQAEDIGRTPDVIAAGRGHPATGLSVTDPSALPRGIRNNNPGNIGKGVGFAGEVEGGDARFATFESPEAGVRALARNLLTYQQQHGLDTVTDILHRWAPPSENDTASYVRTVADRLGVAPDQPLNLADPSTLARLTVAIIQHENGTQPYSGDVIRTGVLSALGDTRGLPAPAIAVDSEGRAGTANQRNAAAARREVSGLTPDVEAAGALHPGAARPADQLAAETPDPISDRRPLALPPPVIDVDSAAVARTADQRMAELQVGTERDQLGLTPDVEAAAARHPASDLSNPADASPPRPVQQPAALPAPRLVVDGDGQVGTAGQLAADAARRASLGLTPDVEAAARQHPARAQIDQAAHEAATSPNNDLPEPTVPQQEAGNYKKGHVRVAGLDISIENPQGSERRGTAPDGSEWVNRMAGHYGYIRGTRASDGDHVDTFVRPGTPPDFDGKVFVVDQVDPRTGKFDEPKVMLGYPNQREAERAYRGSYTRGWRGMGKVTAMDMSTFKRWIAEGDTTRPAAEFQPAVVPAAPGPDILAPNGKPFLTRSAAQRAADAHGNARVVRAGNGFAARPRLDIGRGTDITIVDTATGDEARGPGRSAISDGGDIFASNGRPFLTRQAAARAAEVHGDAEVIRSGSGFVARPRRSAAVAVDEIAAERASLAKMARGDFLRAIRDSGGIHASLAPDIYGDRAHLANRRAPGLFRRGGMSEDSLVEALQQRGYLPMDGDTVDLAPDALGMVRDALEGEPVYTISQMDDASRLAYAEREAERLASGDVDLQAALTSELRGVFHDLDPSMSASMLNEAFDAGAYLSEQGITNEAIREAILERAALRAGDDGDFQAAVESETAATRESSAGRGGRDRSRESESGRPESNQRSEGLTLEPTTPDSLRRAAEAERLRRRQDQQADFKYAQRQQADALHLDFRLTGSDRAADETAARGQRDIFDSREQQRRPRPRAGVSVSDAEYAARSFMDRLPGAARLSVSVVDSVRKIPEARRPSPLAEGVYYPARDRGRIYLVAQNLQSVERLQQVLAHEVVGHYGVEALLGDRFQSVLADVRRLARVPDGEHVTGNEKPGDRSYATMEAVTLAYPEYSSADRAREVLARMAETNTKPYFLQGLYAKMRAALRALGFNLQLTTADIRQMVVDAGKFLRRAPAEQAQARMVKAAAAMAASERGAAPASSRKSVPVAEVSGREFGDPAAGTAAMREQAKEWAAENLRGRQFHNDEQGWNIHVGGRGIKETISRSARLEKLQSVAALPELLKDATLGHSAPPKAAADTSTKAMHTMYAPLSIDGQTHVARLMIREANNGEFFYDHDVSGVSNEKALEAASNIGPGSKPGDMGSRSRATLTIDQLRRVVNSEGRAGWRFEPPAESRRRSQQVDTPEFKRWFGKSKIRRADGQPQVVYHGTKGDFATFAREFIGEGDGHADWGDGFYFADRPDAASTYAEGEGGNVMPVYLKIENPATNEVLLSRRVQDALDDGMGFQEIEDVLRDMGYDGIAFSHKGGGTEYVVFDPQQIKSAIGNRGSFDPSSANIMESRAPGAPAGQAPATPKERPRETPLERPGEVLSKTEKVARDKALGKIGAFTPKETLQERFAAIRERAGQKLVQGVFDQYASLKSLNPVAYMQARLSKGTDGAAEYLIRHGAVKMTDGALDGAGGKGLAQILAGLHGEGDHFMAWIAGNRADRLAAEGREHLFTPDDIATLKRLNLGKMADGRSRREVYAQALKEFSDLQRSVLDVAQDAGLIDREARKTWEHDFYVPFYRVMENDATGTMGPGQVAGLVGQRAFKALKGGTEKLGDLTANTVSNWSHLLSASMKNLAAQGAIKTAVDLGIAQKIRGAEKGSVRIMVNGKEQHYLVYDPLVMDSLTALHHVGSNDPFMKAMRAFKHALTTGVTLSPTFRVRNLLRDSISAISIDSDLKLNPMANMVQGWKATSDQSPTMQKLLAGGGAIRFGSFNDGNARNVKRLAAELNVDPNQVVSSPAALAKVLRKAYDWYQETGDRSETINRAAIYDAARAKGKSHLEASYQARDLLDFTSSGTLPAIRILSQVVPFFNARLQGMYKLGRAATTNAGRFAVVAGAVAAASSLLYLLNKDDDDYRALPDWARNSYWVTKLPGTDMMIYIPKPFEVGALGTVVERATELAFAGNDYRLDDFAHTVAGVLGDQLSMNPIPGAVKPAMEAAFNYDSFRGRDIDSQGQQALPPGERFTPTTSAGAVALGRTIGMSPQRIEHLARGYFGWLGTQALNVADYLARPLSNLPDNPKRDLSRIDNWFAIGDFVKDADPRGSKYIQRFYDEQAEINQVYAAYNQARMIGELDHARELARDPKLQLRGLFQAAGRDMQKLNQQIKRLERSTIPLEEKRAQLERLYQARARVAAMADQRSRAAQ